MRDAGEESEIRDSAPMPSAEEESRIQNSTRCRMQKRNAELGYSTRCGRVERGIRDVSAGGPGAVGGLRVTWLTYCVTNPHPGSSSRIGSNDQIPYSSSAFGIGSKFGVPYSSSAFCIGSKVRIRDSSSALCIGWKFPIPHCVNYRLSSTSRTSPKARTWITLRIGRKPPPSVIGQENGSLKESIITRPA